MRLAPGAIATPVPRPLEELLDGGDTTLVIHSGPRSEISTLIRSSESKRIALVSPWEVPGVPRFDYYPAGNILARASHVVTGAGYNAVADMIFLRDRHTAIPFERRYDDQFARVRDRWITDRDGTPEAARLIAAAATGR